MLIKDVDVEMDERVMAQLLALPYAFDVDDEGHIVMTPLQAPGLTWEELATIHPPLLPENLAWKVETDAQNRIVMSPQPTLGHQSFGTDIILLFNKLLQEGRPFYECGVQTSNGTRVPDVGWISNERVRQQSQNTSYSPSPEICVEIISKSNTRREIDEKKRLYFEVGTLEVWRCERDGKLNFFCPDGPLPASRICPDFPERLNTVL